MIDRVREAAGGLPVEHIVVDLKAEGEANVLVIANETVVGDPLLDRIRERASRSPASFLIICPQSDPSRAEHPEAERRLRRALAILRGEGIDAHGQVSHPDPYTAAMQAVHDERVDEIIVSTFAPERSPWLKKNLVQRLHNDSKLPVEHVVLAEEVRHLMAVHAEAHHGPPAANQSSRVDSSTLGMLLFIASEIMLFGSFFTAYFFVRVVNEAPAWPPHEFHLPVFVAGVNTAILLTSSFTMHWALQAIKRGNRVGMQAGLVLTLALGLVFLLTQAREYSRIGFSPQRRRLRLGLLRADRPPRRARLHRPDAAHVRDDSRLPGPFHARSALGSRDPRDLLALRGRNVDCGLHDGLHPEFLRVPGTSLAVRGGGTVFAHGPVSTGLPAVRGRSCRAGATARRISGSCS